MQGFRLVDVNGYGVNNVDYYAAIWEKTNATTPWNARHGLTARECQSAFTNNFYQGFCLKCVSGHTIHNSERFAAIWKNPYMSGHDLDIIDSKFNSLMAEKDIPAISIAITKDENLVFAKAYGYSDKSVMETANPDNLFRIASVSKFITSIAANALINEGMFTLGSKVFGDGAILGTKFGKKPISGYK